MHAFMHANGKLHRLLKYIAIYEIDNANLLAQNTDQIGANYWQCIFYNNLYI